MAGFEGRVDCTPELQEAYSYIWNFESGTGRGPEPRLSIMCAVSLFRSSHRISARDESMTVAERTEFIKQSLTQLADKNYQERSWFSRGLDISSPDKMFCRIFDNLDFENFLNKKAVSLNLDQRTKGKLLRDRMDKYAGGTPESLDPGWLDAVANASTFFRVSANSSGCSKCNVAVNPSQAIDMPRCSG